MCLDFYQLREHPFGETPDPRFLYFSPSHREALASLFYAIDTGRGFSALIAPPGMGKTTLLNRLHERLKDDIRAFFFSQFDRTSRRLHECLMKELGISRTGEHAQGEIAEALNRNVERGERLVLLIDEAQNLESSILESVRLLSNIETPTAKLLHMVLSGQPQLADNLMKEELCQLRQRISIVCRLRRLTPEETQQYIAHRLRVAGYSGDAIFTSGATELIAGSSQGIPRNINNLCANALSLGFAKGQRTIDESILEEVIRDLDLAGFGRRSNVGLLAGPGLPHEASPPEASSAGNERRAVPQSQNHAVSGSVDSLHSRALPTNEAAPDPVVESRHQVATDLGRPVGAPRQSLPGRTGISSPSAGASISWYKLGTREMAFFAGAIACWLAT